MGKRSKRGRKSGSKNKLTESKDAELLPHVSHTSEPSVLIPGAIDGKQIADDEGSPTRSTPFGFDGVCHKCRQLYLSGMSVTTINETPSFDTGLYVGSLAHISPNSHCSMCRTFYNMRWSTSSTNQYHLHAFSAARMMYGRSLKSLKAKILNKDSHAVEDTALFAVAADCSDPVSFSFTGENSRTGRFLIPSNTNADGEQLPPRLVMESEFREDDWEHNRWLRRMIGNRDQYSRVSINVALQNVGPMGFINEYKGLNPGGLKGFFSTSRFELEERQASGETHVDFAAIQPTETGDPDSPHNLGYLPHHVRPSKIQPIQSLYSERFCGRTMNSGTIDYSLLRGWIRQCQNRCNLQHFIRERKRFQHIPFYLLDCQKREVFKVSSKRHLKYIALSYIWGDVDTNYRTRVTDLPFAVPHRCPNVIEDSIVVVLELGYRYLWVDSLCVSPDASLKHEQIANMDVVYKNAELTIVAVAGRNADYGLPGVGKRPRIDQTQIKIGNHHYVEATVDPWQSLKTSAYQTRGWTYQEFFFSRRRLIFSDFQVWFECRSLCTGPHQQESLSCPPRHLFSEMPDSEHIEDDSLEDAYFHKLSKQSKDIIYGTDGSIEYREISHVEKVFVLLSYEHHVLEFTKRKLTFEADSLQAVSSILDRFTSATHSIYHLHGVPFIPQDMNYIEAGRHHGFQFKYGLLWTHGPLAPPCRRRAAFPSWTWAGWEAPVNWLVSTTDIENFHESPPKAATFNYLRSTGGKRSKLCSVEKWRPSQQSSSHPNELIFSALLYRIPLRASGEAGGEQNGIYLDAQEPFRSRLHVTQIGLESATIKRKHFHGLWLGWNSQMSVNYVLVVQQTTSRDNRFGGKYYERVGVIMISREWYGWTAPLGIQGLLV